MKTIGIDTDNKFFIYEGNSSWGYPLWPSPTLIPVAIVEEMSEALLPDKKQDDIRTMGYVLIDEGYDPLSRVRRGRLFQRYGNSQPHQWHVQPHPAKPSERGSVNANGVLEKSLATFSEFNLTSHLRQVGIERPLFLLGNHHEFTIWSLVDAEATVSGETLVYLKARKVFGAVPKLKLSAVPERFRERVQEKLDTLAEDVYRAGVESVIDRAREAATAILSAYLQSEELSEPGKDLAKLAKVLEGNKFIVANMAKSIAILHSRGKNAEQETRGTRAPTEQDAELAVQSVGIILRDIGWAD